MLVTYLTHYKKTALFFKFQGLNRLAAIALLFLNEEDAFWCLVAIVDEVLPPDYFSKTLKAAQVDQVCYKWSCVVSD